MNNTIPETESLLTKLVEFVKEPISNVHIIVCPAFVCLPIAKQIIGDSQIGIGAQNCHTDLKGAYTGEVSMSMLQSVGCQYVIVGHSERRTIFGETNEIVNQKVKRTIEANITPILCIGETLQERKDNKTFAVLENQINNSLSDINNSDIAKIIIAYEPV